jgi:hypothetical protein
VALGYFVYDGIATDYGPYVVGAPVSGNYTINFPETPTPTFSVPAGTYNATQTVAFADAASKATIFYTTDGSAPTTNSSVYSGPIVVSSTETLEAMAEASGYSNSGVASATYTIEVLPSDFSVLVSPASLTVTAGQSGTASISVIPLTGSTPLFRFSAQGCPQATRASSRQQQ